MKKQWYFTIITGIRYADNTAHASLPSSSMITFVRYISRVRDLIQYCLFVSKGIVLTLSSLLYLHTI